MQTALKWHHNVGGKAKIEVEDMITFAEVDAKGVDQPHNDPLVIQVRIADCKVIKVLVDTGSSINLIIWETLERCVWQTSGSNIQ